VTTAKLKDMEEKKMNNETSSSAESTPAVRIEAKRARRVGTITMGSTLVLAGVAILLYIFYPDLNISLLLSLAPLVLIALGLEMIIMYIVRRGERLRYDFVSTLLSILLIAFSIGSVYMSQFWNEYGPSSRARQEAKFSVARTIETNLSDALKGNELVIGVDVDSYNGLIVDEAGVFNAEKSYVVCNVTMAESKDVKTPQSFAEEVRAIMDRLLALDYDFAMLMFNSTDGYSVILDDPTKMGLSSQLLSQLVDIPGGNLNDASPT
jgi:hypothetical protein